MIRKGVITGDIIHSTRLTTEIKTGLIAEIDSYLKMLKKEFGIKYEMYRGGSFQCLVNKAEDVLRIALMIKTFIRGLNPSDIYDITKRSDAKEKKGTVLTTFVLDARIAIGIGTIESEQKKLSNLDGEAFFISGHLLDEIKNTKRHLAIESNDKYLREWETESVLLDALIRKTTALQCHVVNWKLMGYTETEIANEFNIGQSAVNQRSNGADWNAIETMVNRFEEVYKD